MVTIKSSIKTVAIPLAVTSFMVLQGCKKEEETPATKTNLLVGDWKLTELGGDDYTQYDYSYLFKFKSSGDFQWCYENDIDPTENYCYGSKWKWENSNEETIIIDQLQANNSSIEWKLDVTVLDATRLEGDLTTKFDDGGAYENTESVKFVKIN